MRGFRFRSERRYMAELRLDQRFHFGFFDVELSLIAAKLEMHWTGRARGGGPERLPDHVRNARHIVDGNVHFCYRLECGHVVDLLIDLAKLGLRIAAAGHGDYRRMRQMRVAKACRKIERTNDLRHANTGPARGARITVSHIGGGFFAMTVDARYFGAPLHLGKSAPQHRRHHENMSDAVSRQHVGEYFSAGTLRIVSNCCHCRPRPCSFGNKIHRYAIDAVTQACRRRPIGKNVTKMTAATGAMHLGASHSVALVLLGLDCTADRVIETRPSCPALEFLLRNEQRLVTSG